jgi:hypothetical protein
MRYLQVARRVGIGRLIDVAAKLEDRNVGFLNGLTILGHSLCRRLSLVEQGNQS